MARNATRTLRSLLPLIGAFAVALIAVVLAALLAIEQSDVSTSAREAMQIENSLSEVGAIVTNAETGQRGYLLTGQASYLEPYETARQRINPLMDALAAATASNPARKAYLANLRGLVDRKLDELQETIELKKAGRADEALAIVSNNKGRDLMSEIRNTLVEMRIKETRSVEERLSRLGWLDWLGRAVTLMALFAVIGFGVVSLRIARRRIDALQSTVRELEEATKQRKVAEAQVVQLQKMEAIGQLTGGIAHDFNNMLAIVIGSLDLARRRLVEQPDSRALKYIDQAADGANRAATLTARLLAFSRHQPLEPSVLDVNRLVASTSELLRQTLGEDIEIETVLAGGLWRVFADAAQLENALVNLAVN